MKSWVIALALAAVVGEGLLNMRMQRQLVYEQEFNARRERRLRLEKDEVGPKINLDAVALAFHLEGTSPDVIAALLHCEDGPMNVESGSIDKTDVFAKDIQIDRRSAVEGARTLNRMAWDWLTKTPEGQKVLPSLLTYCSTPYTSLGSLEQRDWARNMQRSIFFYQEHLKFGRDQEVEPLALIMRTPTPNYSLVAEGDQGHPKVARKRKRRKQ